MIPVSLPNPRQNDEAPDRSTNGTFAGRAFALEALRRSQYKFPGRQKIIVSKNWGFTPLRRDEYLEKKAAGRVRVDGAYVQFLSNRGNLKKNMKLYPDAFSTEA